MDYTRNRGMKYIHKNLPREMRGDHGCQSKYTE